MLFNAVDVMLFNGVAPNGAGPKMQPLGRGVAKKFCLGGPKHTTLLQYN